MCPLGGVAQKICDRPHSSRHSRRCSSCTPHHRLTRAVHAMASPVNFSILYQESHSTAIGRGSTPAEIEEISRFVESASPAKVYDEHPDTPFVYEILEKSGWEEKLSSLADRWVEKDENTQRASAQVGRIVTKHGSSLIRTFCMFRLRPFSSPGWIPMSEGLGRDRGKQQTVVFIALTDLNPSNGFFLSLKKGEDVCVDGNELLRFPPTGGGLGVLLCLNL